MRSTITNTQGNHNTGVGVEASKLLTVGSDNTSMGYQAMNTLTNGSNNTVIGSGADVNFSGQVNGSAFGFGAIVDANNKVRIGNTSVISIGGQVGWTNFSDGRFKREVQEDVKGLEFIKKLRPVTYWVDNTAIEQYYRPGTEPAQRNNTAATQRQSGFIAQEVEAAVKQTGFNFSGVDVPTNAKALYGLRYAEFVVPLVKAVQEQQATIEKQQVLMNIMQKEIEELKAKIK